MITIPVNAARLKELRREKKVLQIDVEKEVGIPFGRLTQYETGRSNPTPEFLEGLANYFKVEPKELIDAEQLKLMRGEVLRFAQLVGAKIKI